jgi:hypothetical protein
MIWSRAAATRLDWSSTGASLSNCFFHLHCAVSACISFSSQGDLRPAFIAGLSFSLDGSSAVTQQIEFALFMRALMLR